MEILSKLYEGKAKEIFTTDDADQVVIRFKDAATAFDGKKKGTIQKKGIMNLKISALFFQLLEKEGIQTHYLATLNDRDMLARKLSIVPVEVVVRNTAAGSLAKRLGLEEGTSMSLPIVEFYYKDDDLGDPMINHYHIRARKMADDDTVKEMEENALAVNEILTRFLKERKIQLVDFKLEFGLYHGKVLLGDEISPDTCRFWDMESKKKMDKDRFRRDLGQVEEVYEEVLSRMEGSNK